LARLADVVAKDLGMRCDRREERLGERCLGRHPHRGDALGSEERLDETQLRSGHVVEAGQQLRAQRCHRDQLRRLRQTIGGVDSVQLRDQSFVLGPCAEEDFRPTRIAQATRSRRTFADIR
jgi:hypothetical protein